MLIKILIIAAAIGLILFLVLPKRRVPEVRVVARKDGRLLVSLLTSAALLLGILAFFCLLLWLGGITGVITGGGEVIHEGGLLRIMGVLLLLAIVCAIGAWLKRSR